MTRCNDYQWQETSSFDPDNPPKYFTPEEIAERNGVSVKRVVCAIKLGSVSAIEWDDGDWILTQADWDSRGGVEQR